MIKTPDRIGEISYSNTGTKMEIIAYRNSRDIDVKCDNGGITRNIHYCHFKNGSVKNPFDISVCGVGFLGVGTHKASINNKQTSKYTTWKSMLERCYDTGYQERQPTYLGCYVCEEWFNFQTFSDWYDENYYSIKDETMNLDKDILLKGNKKYSPLTCVFVPKSINNIFTSRRNYRSDTYIGVYSFKDGKSYVARCNDGSGKMVHLGYHANAEKAFSAYKDFKEAIIEKIANEYRDSIPDKLYNALINYEVEIKD